MSIVLVIIGLIVGGVTVGVDLIKAAEIRSQISQIQKYQVAVTTFKLKYNALPGDIKEPYATQFGFKTRGTSGYGGEGNGDGILKGSCEGPYSGFMYQGCGENVMFWVDLSKAGLIEETLDTATPATNPGNLSQSDLAQYYPAAKIGKGNRIYAYSENGINYFGISITTQITGGYALYSSPGTTVFQASSIDSKIDDGKPLTGKVTNTYLNGGGAMWGIGAPLSYQGARSPTYYPYASPAITSCMDHGSVPLASSTVQDYTYYMPNIDKMNCALSIAIQP